MRALISVSDKTGVVDLAKKLNALNIEVISTGGTYHILQQAGVKVVAVEEVTMFPEMMDGRVKTLHPKIHGGLLANRKSIEHMKQLEEQNIKPIDFVFVNLYPFKETLLSKKPHEDMIENIDIGGPSMLRSASKNYDSVTVVVDHNDYNVVLEQLETMGETSLQLRKELAAKAFRYTASYDALIADYLTEGKYTEKMTLTYDMKQTLRYGENPQQEACFYANGIPVPFSIASAKQLHGKELSYNNIKDADAGLRLIREFEEPTAVALKHMNPCGVGLGDTVEEAFDRCYNADPISIFGGIVVLNRAVTLELAEKLSNIFLEIIVAPEFNADALDLLNKKKNIRLLTVDFANNKKQGEEYVSVLGGLLVQDEDSIDDDRENWEVMTEKEPSDFELDAMSLGMKVVKAVKSNAIVIANDKQTLGIGAGQMNRIGAAKIALEQAKESGADLSKVVLASDAFFPMKDTVELASEYGIKAIVQPGGSVKDQESIDVANEHDIAMIRTKTRHFKH